MQKNANQNDYVLELFKGRDRFSAPFKVLDDGFVYATNSFMAVRIDEKIPSREYKKIEGSDGVPKVFDQSASMSTSKITVHVDTVLGILATHGLHIDKEKKCTECDGTGESSCWHCGSDSECEDCDGTGKLQAGATPIKSVRFTKTQIELNGTTFTAEYLNAVLITALIRGVNVFIIDVHGSKAFIDLGAFEIILMTCNA